MHRKYLEETGIKKYRSTERLLDYLNEARSDEYWEPLSYSSDPEYGEVDSQLFEFLDDGILEG